MSSGVSVNVVDFHDPEQQKSLLELLICMRGIQWEEAKP